MVFWCGDEVDELTKFSLEGGLWDQADAWMEIESFSQGSMSDLTFFPFTLTHIVKQFNQADVVRLLPEVLLEEEVYRCLEHEGIVDGDVADSLLDKGVAAREAAR